MKVYTSAFHFGPFALCMRLHSAPCTTLVRQHDRDRALQDCRAQLCSGCNNAIASWQEAAKVFKYLERNSVAVVEADTPAITGAYGVDNLRNNASHAIIFVSPYHV